MKPPVTSSTEWMIQSALTELLRIDRALCAASGSGCYDGEEIERALHAIADAAQIVRDFWKTEYHS